MAMRTAEQARGKMGREPNGQQDYFRFLLRMPEDMARKLDALAKVDYSPMNAYMLRVFRDYLKAHHAEVEEALRETGAAVPGPAPEPGRRTLKRSS